MSHENLRVQLTADFPVEFLRRRGGGSGIAAALRGAGFRVRVQYAPRHGGVLVCGSDRGLPSARRIPLGAVWVMVIVPARPGLGVAMVTWLPEENAPDTLVSLPTYDLSPAAVLDLVDEVRRIRRLHECRGGAGGWAQLDRSEGLTDDAALLVGGWR